MTENESCFSTLNGKITYIGRVSSFSFIEIKNKSFHYSFIIDSLDNNSLFAYTAQINDSIIRKGNYIELHHNNSITNWHISSCEDIPYTSDSINYDYATGRIYKITTESNQYYYYEYSVNNKKYTDYDFRLDNAKIGDTFVVAYNKDSPELNRIFNRKVQKK